MRILGIDCGSETAGWGVVEADAQGTTFIAADQVDLNRGEPLAERLLEFARQLRLVIEQFRPDEAAVEDVFHAKNARSALRLAHTRGAALLILAERGVPYAEYSPAQVKLSVTGYGRATKEQVRHMVEALLGVSLVSVAEDACDALAVALCHALRSGYSVGASGTL